MKQLHVFTITPWFGHHTSDFDDLLYLPSASVQLCIKVGSSQPRVLELCQVGALECMGRSITVASHDDCKWPVEASASCGDCKPGTVCQGESFEGCFLLLNE